MAKMLLDIRRSSGKAFALGMLVGIGAPLVIWVITGQAVWPLVAAGGLIIAAACILRAIEMRQGSGLASSYRKTLASTVPFNPETQYPVIRASICTGERVAGFKDKASGRFTEVLLLASEEDEQAFKKAYGIEELKTEY